MKKNNKGFTLIEMMVVIAIVAVLISVIVPVMNGNTDKAAAATNAANLRGVEGEIVSMMLIDPYAFGDQGKKKGKLETEIGLREVGDDVLAEWIDDLEAAEAELAEAKAKAEGITQEELDAERAQLESTLKNSVEKYFPGHTFNPDYVLDDYKERAENASGIMDKIKYGAIYAAYLTYDNAVKPNYDKQKLLDNVTAAQETRDKAEADLNKAREENTNKLGEAKKNLADMWYYKAVDGVITLTRDDNTTVTIPAPASKKVNIDPVNIDKGVEMIVFVDTINYEAYAFYGDYEDIDFAQVADQKAAE